MFLTEALFFFLHVQCTIHEEPLALRVNHSLFLKFLRDLNHRGNNLIKFLFIYFFLIKFLFFYVCVC